VIPADVTVSDDDAGARLNLDRVLADVIAPEPVERDTNRAVPPPHPLRRKRLAPGVHAFHAPAPGKVPHQRPVNANVQGGRSVFAHAVWNCA
jgi:hypothetical protein